MKLKDTGKLPKKEIEEIDENITWFLDGYTPEDAYREGEVQGRNQKLSELGEIDLNELIDEEKIKELIHKVSFEYADFKRQGRSQKGINPQLAQAIKSSNIWKEKSIT